MEEEVKKLDWFFYVVFGNQRTDNFFKISELMATKGITLIPVQYQQLIQIQTEAKLLPVILCIDNMLAKRKSSDKMMSFMKRLVLMKKIALYHFSSFSDLKLNCYTKEAQYHFYSLPINLEKAIDEVIFKQLEILADDRRWRWGNYMGVK